MQALATLDVLVELVNGQPTTTSLDVSKHFKKRHDNVLRAIENLDCSPEFNALNFEAVEYQDPKGESRPMVRMTRDGFMFLCMGFTGKEAAQLKEAYIGAFNRMEEKLRAEQAFELPPLAIQRWLTTYDSKGNQHTRLLPIGSFVMTVPEFVEHLPHMNHFELPTNQLFALAMQAMGMLQQRKVNFAGFTL